MMTPAQRRALRDHLIEKAHFKALEAIAKAARKFIREETNSASGEKRPYLRLDPLVELVVHCAAVIRALGPVEPSAPPAKVPKGMKAWAAVEPSRGALTLRVWYRGGREYLAAAAGAIADAISDPMRGLPFRIIHSEIMRAASLNGYVSIFRVAEAPTPSLNRPPYQRTHAPPRAR